MIKGGKRNPTPFIFHFNIGDNFIVNSLVCCMETLDVEVILDDPSEKILVQPAVLTASVKDQILEYLLQNASSRAIPMNEYLKQFNIDRLEGFVSFFSKLESQELIRCDGNFGWLGSRNDGVLLDLSHPLAQFSCRLLPQGVDYVQQKMNQKQVEQEVILLKQQSPSVPWYEHWVFWLICVVAFMATMIGFVEYNNIY